MEEYQIGDWSSGKKHKAEMTLNVRPPTSTEHPIMIERIFSPEGRILSSQTEAQLTTTDVAVTVTSVPSVTTMAATNVPPDSDASTLEEMTTTEDADYDLPNMTDIVETGNGTATMSRAVSSVVRDEVRECKAVLFSLSAKYFAASSSL